MEPVRFGGEKLKDDAKSRPWRSPKVTWPAASSAEVRLGAPGSGPKPAGKLPVSVAPAAEPTRDATVQPAELKVSVVGRAAADKAGVDGLLLSVSRTDSAKGKQPVRVKVDYSAFRGAYGGDWAARLRLVELPACVLTNPQSPGCRTARSLKTSNDTERGTLTASAAPAAGGTPTVLAATAGASGSSGSYKATQLEASGSWSGGGSTGAFTWSYPIATPVVPGDLQPNISLGYSSQSVDGQTAASNNQSGWIGDGWSWQPGYIERRYKACDDDKDGGTNTTKVGDQCWFNDNATLSLGGTTTELVRDATKGWHPAQDTGQKVEKLTGASNGDKGTAGVDGAGEHWKVTTTDGTQYFFGLNRLPGWSDHGTAADDPVTNSTLTTPVFGNQSGEPCYNASFASAWCQQAWRWQLDYVVDPHGNAMAYYWNTETNNYGRNVSETTGKATVTPYNRAGYLDHIEYGLRSNSVYTAKAMGRVDFAVSERCLTDCGTFDAAHAKNWPDVPFDLYCKDGASECKDQFAPSFWSRKRLSTITTKVLTGGAYKEVDSWSLKQGFPPAGDGLSTPMWLESIQRTGKVGGSATLPPVTFAGEQMANRVDKTGDGLAPFIRLRMSQIGTETGGTIGAIYSKPDCTSATLPPADATNTTRCYPVKWAFEGETAKEDWFNSYVVTKVLEGDNLAETPDTTTEYTYSGGAKWAKNTDEFTKKNDRAYSVSRGYGLVQTRKGAGSEPRTLTETRYFRGIDGAAVKDSAGVAVTDREQFAGWARESATYNGNDTSKLVSATSYTPWRSAATAVRTRADLPDLTAYLTGTLKEDLRTTVAGGERKSSLTRTFNTYGQITTVSDTGDAAKTGDEQCTASTYVPNTTNWLLDKVSRTEVTAVTCGATVTRPADVISDERTYYDGATSLTAAPVKGDSTKFEKINGAGNGYETETSALVADIDVYGRVLVAKDAYSETTTTTYTPAQGEVATKIVATNQRTHPTTTELDPLRGQPLKVSDPNARVTSTLYDPLGRVAKVWLPSRSAATYPDSPSNSFDYQIRAGGPVVITSKSLNHQGNSVTSYAFYDGLLRERQTQTPSPDDKGRLVTETFYNSLGQAWRSSGTYYAAGPAEPVLITGQETKYPASADTVFDGAGRVVAVIDRKFGDETKRTSTTYTGDTTTVVPPQGGVATTAVTDALGRTTELKQYTDKDRTTSQSTTYTYNKLGRLAQVTDPSGAQWKYGYDAAGRQNHVEDPDKGATDTTYDKGGRATDVVNVQGISLHTDYDVLGRPTALYQGTTKRAAWDYDKASKGIGQLSSTTRHDGANSYISTVLNYNAFYKPVVSQLTVPASEGALAGTYEWTDVYNANTGQLMETAQPAMGGLPAEDVVNEYGFSSGLPMSMSAGGDTVLASVAYDHYGRAAQQEFGAFGQHLWKNSEYDEHTGALTRAFTDREVAPQRIDDVRYTYDPAGNVKKIGTVTGQDATAASDTQCFALDALRRITDAWTATDNCAAQSPTPAVVGGPDAYWTSYAYDSVGNRKTETQHAAAAGPASDITRTYAAPKAGTHRLGDITQTGPGARTETYAFDEVGNLHTRKIGDADTETFEWDVEGHLASTTQVTDTTSYVYDTSGQRLVRRDSTGTTLYLPGGNELLLDKAGKVTGTRYYTAAGETVALRKGTKLTFLINDHHATSTTQVTADAAQTVTRRKSTIFGSARGTQPSTWSGDRGFVGGTTDADTELTHLGAREYDPVTGRFISVDPVMDLTDPQQAHGYTYANNNPVAFSDPSGLWLDDGTGHSAPGGHGGGPGAPKKTHETTPAEAKAKDNPVNVVEKAISDAAKSYLTPAQYNEWRPRWNALLAPQRAQKKEVTEDDLIAYAANTCFGSQKCPKKLANFVEDLDHLRVMQYGGSGGRGPGVKFSFAKQLRKGVQDLRQRFKLGCQCFLAGTQVLMDDGNHKSIEDVEVGDQVLATDPDTGRTSARKVTRLIVTDSDKKFNELTIRTPDGDEKLVATYEHPFWVESEQRWLAASELKPGMSLRSDEGKYLRVEANRPFEDRVRTYNLSVEGVHTYYVLAGKTPVLVHNAGSDPGPGMANVGRWMSPDEYQKMVSTGMVQEGKGGYTYVVSPGDPEAYRPTYKGSIYVEFDVPKSSIIAGGRPGDYKMANPDTLFGRILAKKGGTPGMPEARNIRKGGSVC
ncbi:polymorphic toxin-type HINT domain-containing protein [Streptomyces sp. NBC_01433]|uniref:TreTu family toxin n=1 Tax=Streptomyces sp. NBC_01433 TaxID=2903864 RepID=UPI0022569CBA|nr:polymorphic toxin-type HINT domain-containing protein [Streptomyces sp. NBC_01433]MCX4674732.1 polymorphic toxin-type HINT domain-containing protein [Streptomyces sp. NBC_01433]